MRQALFIFTLACFTLGSSISSFAKETSTAVDEDMSMTAMELADDMGVGWNLGNALDAYDINGGNETAWGNPVITKELIEAVKEAGFDTIRIPISYMNRIGEAPDYLIDEEWMERIKEVVDYAMEADLYVVINIHHDGKYDTDYGAWLNLNSDEQDEIEAKFQRVWEQTAELFLDYDSSLIFESMNEIMEENNYSAPRYKSSYERINTYNQIFVDTVRASGGQNANRFLIVPGYNTNIEYTAGNYGFELPEDSAEDKLMVSVHYYDPYDFTLNEGNDSIYSWGKEAIGKGSVNYHMDSSVDASMSQLKECFIDLGIPVFVGEYGAIDKSFVHSENEAYRAYYYKYVSHAVREIGGVPCCWDNGWNGNYGFALFDRSNGEVLHPDIIEGIMDSNTKND